jgi:hypothetical protein
MESRGREQAVRLVSRKNWPRKNISQKQLGSPVFSPKLCEKRAIQSGYGPLSNFFRKTLIAKKYLSKNYFLLQILLKS